MKALAEAFPDPDTPTGVDWTRSGPAGDTAPDQHLAGESGKNRTTIHQSTIGTVTYP